MKKHKLPPARYQWLIPALVILLCVGFFVAAMHIAQPHLEKWLPRLVETFS